MTDFKTDSCVLLKSFLDPTGVNTVSRYMEYAVRQNCFKTDGKTSTYSRYADPLIETILYNSCAELEQVTELSLYPTYSYARVYLQGDKLEPHVDRPSCEISVSVHVATQGEAWPIWMKVVGKEPVSFILEPGDAVVYKGCEVTHWREEAVDTKLNAQFMLHYVDKSGPHAEYKWDKRFGIGSLITTRSA